jgi:hypothetical protein
MKAPQSNTRDRFCYIGCGGYWPGQTIATYLDHAARTSSIAGRMRSRASARGTPDIKRSS